MRLVICELVDEGVLFLGQNTYKLDTPYIFETAFLSLMERSVLCPDVIVLLMVCQRPHGRTAHDHWHLYAFLCLGNYACGAAILPSTGETDWQTSSAFKCLWYCVDCQQDGLSGGGVLRRRRWLSLQRTCTSLAQSLYFMLLV